MDRRCYLTGTDRRPLLQLEFDPGDRLDDGTSLLAWVRALPSRRWNRHERLWEVSATGADPQQVLEQARFTINLHSRNHDSPLAGAWSLEEVADPLLRLSSRNPSMVLVRPRLAGFALTRDRLGEGATWDKATGRFEVGVGELLTPTGKPKPGLVMDEAIVAAARAARAGAVELESAGALATASSVDGAGQAGQEALARVGDVPAGFGVDLYPYQRAGAIAAACGNRLLADDMGLGKTLISLAAVEISGAKRLLVVSPPVALTQWQREVINAGVCRDGGGAGTHCPAKSRPRHGARTTTATQVTVVSASVKDPDLPDGPGVVVVSDSLLASRPRLSAALATWAPDALIVDEAHRHKTWDSARSKAVRALATRVPGLRVALTGTPMLANPVDLAGPMAITGQLDPIFGGYGAFTNRYARKNKFGAWMPRKNRLPELRQIFDERVWVRRRKAAVIDLPAKSRQDMIVDVDLSRFRAAHKEVEAKVADWVDEVIGETGKPPTTAQVRTFARDSIALSSLLRRAAGLAKVKAATEHIGEWVEAGGSQTDADGKRRFERPLVVWTHHRDVSEAMAAAVPEAVGGAEVIVGGTSHADRTRIVDAFQDGTVPVLVASITAAGTGITLTRSSDALFVETDWTPALVQQAEDRLHRISATRPVVITTMVAPGTLDERVQKVLAGKGQMLQQMMGEDQDVSVVEFEGDEVAAPAQIIEEIVAQVIVRRRKSARTRLAASAGPSEAA